MEAQYGKFLDMIRAVRINVPLVDVLAEMPNYGKFLKELISNKNKIEQISAAFLSDESSKMIQNKFPPKLGDPGSFLIPCTFNKTFSCNALADLGASINLVSYCLYAKLSLETLKPVKMSVRLADRSFQYPVGIAENILVEVDKFIYPDDFIILEMEEDSKVMAAPIISISSDSSEESMAGPIVASNVGTVYVVSPAEVLDLVDYSSSSDSDPSEDSLPPVADLPLVSPSRSSSYDTLAPLSEFPLAPIVAPPEIYRRSTTLIRPDDAIPFGRPYRTHSNGPRRFLTTRKRVGPILARILAWSAPLSTPYPLTTSESSLGLSFERSLDSSSLSSGPSRKRCWSPTASVPSPTHDSRLIAPTPIDILPPRKRFKDSYSSEDSGEEHMEVDTADAEAVADVGISDGVVAHTRDGVGIRVEITASDVREDDEEFEVEASAADTREITIDPLAIGDSSESSRGCIPDLEDTIYDIVHYMLEVRIDRITKIETTQRQLETSQLVASRERARLVERIRSLRLEYLKVRAMLSIERDRVDNIHCYMALSQEEFCQVRRNRDDTRGDLGGLSHITMTITRSGMTPEAIEELINRRVEEALAAHEATLAANALEAKNQSQNGSDGDNGNGGNGNGKNGNGGNGNPNENGRGDRPVARECTYQDFMKCQPLNFMGTEGVVGLIRWFEKMETVFHISNCPEKYQVKYATCTLLNSALTWWNSHKRTIGIETAFAMS
ncbi:putative reverse transcriptase domain-containing protein [Tanacetum coccineum]